MILVIVGCWFGFFALIDKFILPRLIRMRNRHTRQQRQEQQHKRSGTIFSWVSVAKSRMMIPLVNFGLMFLDPMFNSTIALIVIDEVGVGWKLLGVLISIMFLLVGFFFGVVRS